MSMICGLCQVTQVEADRLLADPDQIVEFLEEPKDAIDLDKAWHGIHYLLTRSAWNGDEPLCYLVKGGEDIGDIDVGYGHARLLRPAQVENFSNALSAITSDDLSKRFDPQTMLKEDIYPSIWDRGPKDDDTLGYLLWYFESLKPFVQRATEQKNSIIIYLT